MKADGTCRTGRRLSSGNLNILSSIRAKDRKKRSTAKIKTHQNQLFLFVQRLILLSKVISATDKHNRQVLRHMIDEGLQIIQPAINNINHHICCYFKGKKNVLHLSRYSLRSLLPISWKFLLEIAVIDRRNEYIRYSTSRKKMVRMD